MLVSRLKVVTAVDPEALIRVLDVLKSYDVVPRRVLANCVAVRGPTHREMLEIEIDVAASAVRPEGLRIIATKMNQMAVVLSAVVGE